MSTILAAIALVALAMLGLAIGLAFGRPPLERACGGEACQKACAGCDRLGQEARHD
tara:strand:+ start:640 stop:807 length:168 start_codon:yes stop_codon:yes gene_type:complete